MSWLLMEEDEFLEEQKRKKKERKILLDAWVITPHEHYAEEVKDVGRLIGFTLFKAFRIEKILNWLAKILNKIY